MKIKKLNQHGFDHIFVMVFAMLAIGVTGTYMIVSSSAATKIRTSSNIVDVSWPQCLSLVKANYGVIGLNYSKPMTINPCIKKEAKYISHKAIYVNASYKGQGVRTSKYGCAAKTTSCYAYNSGYKAGLYDIKVAAHRGLYSNLWWIDVEEGKTPNYWWGNNNDLNVQYLKGMMQAISSQGIPNIGFYSTPLQWGHITGGWQNNHPSWHATGQSPPSGGHSAAVEHCGTGFTGGSVWLVQYAEPGLDVNYNCGDSFHANL
jgi:hypothetical protein